MPLAEGIGEMWRSVRRRVRVAAEQEPSGHVTGPGALAPPVVPAPRRAAGSPDISAVRRHEMPLELEAIFAHQERLRLVRDGATE